jgi:hypothetical protein
MSILFGVRAADGESVAEEQLRGLRKRQDVMQRMGHSFWYGRTWGWGSSPATRTSVRSSMPSRQWRRGAICSHSMEGSTITKSCAWNLSCRASRRQTRRLFLRPLIGGEKAVSRGWSEIGLWLCGRTLTVFSTLRGITLEHGLSTTRPHKGECDGARILRPSSLIHLREESTKSMRPVISPVCPFGELTPYEHVRAVPPAHFIRIEGQSISRKQHWSCWRPRARSAIGQTTTTGSTSSRFSKKR